MWSWRRSRRGGGVWSWWRSRRHDDAVVLAKACSRGGGAVVLAKLSGEHAWFFVVAYDRRAAGFVAQLASFVCRCVAVVDKDVDGEAYSVEAAVGEAVKDEAAVQMCLASRAETSSAPRLQFNTQRRGPGDWNWKWCGPSEVGRQGEAARCHLREGWVECFCSVHAFDEEILSVMQQSWALSVEPCAIPVRDACQSCCEAFFVLGQLDIIPRVFGLLRQQDSPCPG